MSIFDELRAHAGSPFEAARMPPLGAYASDEVLEREVSDLFWRDCVCGGELPTCRGSATASRPRSRGATGHSGR